MPEHIRSAGEPWWFALRMYAFWMFFFAFYRALFVIWLRPNWSSEGPWASFLHALPLDLSTAGYFVVVPLFLWYIGMAGGPRVWRVLRYVLNAFNLGLILFFVMAFTANVFLYAEWHTPLNSRAFDNFRTPEFVLDSMSLPFKIGGVALYICLIWGWWRVFKKITGAFAGPPERSLIHIPSAPVLLGCTLLLIRGGVGKMPINESAVYYSTHPFNNHAATNTAWHLFHSLIEARSTVNHYRSSDPETAHCQVAKLYAPGKVEKQPQRWLASSEQRPNVVFIIMESMTAQVVEELGGVPGVCPNLGLLAREGLLFEQCYGSGYRTDQGLVSVLAGFPAQPDQSVVLHEDKAAKLPCLSKTLRKEGYATSFFYGGQLTFANIGTWLYNQQFDQIISIDDFPRSEVKQLWGADDATIFAKAVETLRQTRQPFFSTVMTLSLHQPYDVPYESRWNGADEREKFLNCAAFADYAIGEFFRLAAAEPWYQNTVFVLVADHGHPQPDNQNMDSPRARQVPLLITGPLIRPEWRGRRIEKIGNHHDIPATILGALGVSSISFPWSKNLLDDRTTDFAYYSNENGIGWITPQGAGFFPFAQKQWKWYQGALDSNNQVTARAYLQTMYDEYLGL